MKTLDKRVYCDEPPIYEYSNYNTRYRGRHDADPERTKCLEAQFIRIRGLMAQGVIPDPDKDKAGGMKPLKARSKK